MATGKIRGARAMVDGPTHELRVSQRTQESGARENERSGRIDYFPR